MKKISVVVASLAIGLCAASNASAAVLVSIAGQISDFDNQATFDGMQNGASLANYVEDGILFSATGIAAGIGGPNPFDGLDVGATIANGGFFATQEVSRFEFALADGSEFDAFSFVFGRLSPSSFSIQSILSIQTFFNGVQTNEKFAFLFPSEILRVTAVGEQFDRVVLRATGLSGPDDNHAFAIDNFRINSVDGAAVVPAPPALVLLLTGWAALSGGWLARRARPDRPIG